MIRQKLAAHLYWLGHALSRTRAEFDDLRDEARDGARAFDALVYFGHMSPEDIRAFRAAVFAELNLEDDGRVSLPVAVRRGSTAFYVRGEAPHAEGAGLRVLTLIRNALHRAGLTTNSMQIEIREADLSWEA